MATIYKVTGNTVSVHNHKQLSLTQDQRLVWLLIWGKDLLKIGSSTCILTSVFAGGVKNSDNNQYPLQTVSVPTLCLTKERSQVELEYKTRMMLSSM